MCKPPASITLAWRCSQSFCMSAIFDSLALPFSVRAFISASRLPPSTISVPRPAIFVAIVTAPGRPALTIILASSSCCLAFRTLCSILAAFNMPDNSSDVSTDAVPTKTGAPLSTILFMSSITASNFSS